MSRNFGVTGSTGIGGNHPSSPHYRANTTRPDPLPLPSGLILAPRPSFELSQVGEPSFDERELGAGFLFLAVILAPLLFVGLTVVGYLTFVA